MTPDPDRLQTLVLARAHTSAKPMTAAAIAKDLARFAPEAGPAWRAAVDGAIAALVEQKVLGDKREVIDAGALGKRLGSSSKYKWQQLTDRLLPALGLGLPPKESFGKGVLEGRDEWAAAIIGRALGMWTGGRPPKVAALCNQLVWDRLGLPGKAKTLPDEVRGLFLQRELSTSAAPTDRLLRLLAARELGVQQTDLRALRDALVGRWLGAEVLDGSEVRPSEAAVIAEAQAGPSHAGGSPFLDALRLAAASVGEEGRFGEHNVFIAAAFDALHRERAWHGLSLDDFKKQLLEAHRNGEVVLARADLISAMDEDLVERSRTPTPGGSHFHFLVREGA
jgi:hypothetical protein